MYDDVITITIDQTAPLVVSSGQSFTLSASATSSAGLPVDISWRLPDGNVSVDTSSLTTSIAAEGPTNIVITASDYIGGYTEVSFPVTVGTSEASFIELVFYTIGDRFRIRTLAQSVNHFRGTTMQ